MDVFAIIPLPHHLKASTHLLPPYPTPRALSNLQANQRSLLYNPLHNKKKSAPRYYANHHPLHKYAHTHTHWTGFFFAVWVAVQNYQFPCHPLAQLCQIQAITSYDSIILIVMPSTTTTPQNYHHHQRNRQVEGISVKFFGRVFTPSEFFFLFWIDWINNVRLDI